MLLTPELDFRLGKNNLISLHILSYVNYQFSKCYTGKFSRLNYETVLLDSASIHGNVHMYIHIKGYKTHGNREKITTNSV